MSKSLCKLHDVLTKDIEAYVVLVDRPRYACTDCGRVANDKKNLCEPKRLPAPEGKGGSGEKKKGRKKDDKKGGKKGAKK